MNPREQLEAKASGMTEDQLKQAIYNVERGYLGGIITAGEYDLAMSVIRAEQAKIRIAENAARRGSAG